MKNNFEFTEHENNVIITKYIGTDTHVIIPDKINGKFVTAIGNSTYRKRKNITHIGFSNLITIDDAAFANCSNVTDISIPDSVTTIGDYTFAYCSNLTNISISDSVVSIGKFAFYKCHKLTNIKLPNFITSMENPHNCLT